LDETPRDKRTREDCSLSVSGSQEEDLLVAVNLSDMTDETPCKPGTREQERTAHSLLAALMRKISWWQSIYQI